MTPEERKKVQEALAKSGSSMVLPEQEIRGHAEPEPKAASPLSWGPDHWREELKGPASKAARAAKGALEMMAPFDYQQKALESAAEAAKDPEKTLRRVTNPLRLAPDPEPPKAAAPEAKEGDKETDKQAYGPPKTVATGVPIIPGGGGGGGGRVGMKEQVQDQYLRARPEDLDAMHEAERTYQGASEREANAVAHQREAESNSLAGQEAMLRNVQQDADQAEANRKILAESKLAQLDEHILDAKKAAKIDPDHYWATKDGGQKVIAGIGVLLGAAMNFISMGRIQNFFLDQINRAVDQDIEAQKANADQKWKSVEAEKVSLDKLSQMFGDERKAEDVRRLNGLHVAETQLKAVLAQTDKDVIKARGEKGLAALQMEQAQLRTKLFGHGITETSSATIGGGGGGPGYPQPKHTVTLPDGRVVSMESEKSQDRLSEALDFRSELSTAYRSLAAIERAGPGKLGAVKYLTERRRLAADILRLDNSKAKQGALQKEDRIVASQASGTVGLLSSGAMRFAGHNPAEVLERAATHMEQSTDELIRSHRGALYQPAIDPRTGGRVLVPLGELYDNTHSAASAARPPSLGKVK